MNQQPDKFFREKLINYQRPAPAGAWDRIESALEKKTRYNFVWWKIAASLLLLAIVGYVIWVYETPNADSQPLAQVENKIEPSVKQNDVIKAESYQPKGETIKKDNTPPKATSLPEPEKKMNKKIKQATAPIIAESSKSSTIEPTPSLLEELEESMQPIVTKKEQESVDFHVESFEKSSTITLTITADETNKYLDKNALAKATSEERKSSTLKKLLMKANELKSNQDPFGDLREKKNEILALNFKNEKRGQNK